PSPHGGGGQGGGAEGIWCAELIRAGAAGAARPAAAAATAALAREVEGRLAATGDGKARDEHPGLGRFAGRALLGGVPLGKPGQDLELLRAALAPILVDGHLSERF